MKPEFKTIFYEESIDEKEQYQKVAREILERFPNAKVKRVESHNKIPELIEMDPAEWIASKKDYLVIGIKKSFVINLTINLLTLLPPLIQLVVSLHASIAT